MNKQQEPRLRFKGFTGAWEEKKIGEIFNVTSGTTPLRSNQNYFSNGVINWVKTTDLNNSILDKTEEKISEIALNETSLKVLPKNTLFVAMYGGFNQIGRTGLLNMEATCNQALAAILPDKSQNPFYLLTYLNYSVEYWKGIAASSRKDPNITKQDVLDFECFFPSLPEQTHLSLFFRHLDRQIAESRAVLEKSRQLKKAMLAKMFPTNGEKIPKIRFKGFEGEWESRKLGEISDFAKGKGLSKSSIDSNGNTPCILYGELYTKYDCYINKVFSSTNEKIENPILTKSNDVLLPTSDVTPNGLAKACSIYFDDIVLGGDILVIRSTEMFGLFFAHYVESNPFMIIEKATGTTVFHIYEKDLRDIVLLLPSYEEQTAIGNFFRQLDETIALQSAEVEKLNQLKKGLLAAMLV